MLLNKGDKRNRVAECLYNQIMDHHKVGEVDRRNSSRICNTVELDVRWAVYTRRMDGDEIFGALHDLEGISGWRQRDMVRSSGVVLSSIRFACFI